MRWAREQIRQNSCRAESAGTHCRGAVRSFSEEFATLEEQVHFPEESERQIPLPSLICYDLAA
jgi:hypothetical protein